MADDGGWVRHDDPSAGITVLYPEEWNRASISLTPRLAEPVELISLGTHTLRAGAASCSQMPGYALDDMSETDAFITVQERNLTPSSRQSTDDFPPRQGEFSLDAKDALVGAACTDNTGIQTWWVPFSDAGRAFYLNIAIGKSAGEETRRQVLGIVKSMSFEANQPTRVAPSPPGAGQRDDGRRVHRIPDVEPA